MRQECFHGLKVARAGRSIDTAQGDGAMAGTRRCRDSSLLFSFFVQPRAILHIAVMYRLPTVRGASRYVTPGPLAANKIIVGK